MSRIPEQAEFLLAFCDLIRWGTEQGYVLTGGELWRPLEMQEIYLKTGRSKTLKSEHLNRLAVDLNIFRRNADGSLRLCTRDEIKPLGEYWEQMHPRHRWGGSWRGAVEAKRSDFIDAPHFERQ